MKICELCIKNYSDRAELVRILAFAGYKVSIEERETHLGAYPEKDYYVIVEGKQPEEV